MLAITLSFVAVLYLTGLRADRAGSRAVTEPVAHTGGAGHAAEGTDAKQSGLSPGSVTSCDCVPRARFEHMRHLAYVRGKYAHRYHKMLLAKPSVIEALNLACTIYGHCTELWRKARCESGLNPNARNGSEASGLLQFLPSTWRTTPFAGFSIFSAYANALAGGWMHVHGRGGEWVCR